MRTTLTAPLAIGDKVYILVPRDATAYIQCPWCGVTGTITFTTPDGASETTKCPKCDGKGKLKAGKLATVYDVKRKEIEGVILQAGVIGYSGQSIPVQYVLSGDHQYRSIEADSAWKPPVGATYTDVSKLYWLNKADAEAVAARLSDKG